MLDHEHNRTTGISEIEDARQQYLHDFNTAIQSAESKGIEKGSRVAQVTTLVRILAKRFGQVPQAVVEKLHATNDFDRLSQLTDLSLDCKTLDEFDAAL